MDCKKNPRTNFKDIDDVTRKEARKSDLSSQFFGATTFLLPNYRIDPIS